ncbi:unnamed protein product [Adineta steineri]|uniref:Peroxisomal membrane protein PEX14 n=1 Tax=Adineta steineri TaxID=433720 RepID=A0A815PB02_9BILA|nr:unnamed protein product [Adineta steineri]CAF1446596.1 unnamed protein product [Adineta steineri]CAF1492481.1 unnamed protein product [Adineta steineri]
MTEQRSTSDNVRSELVDIAVGFLKNPKIANEHMERKRDFLQKKGLTDSEINNAFQLIPPPEITKQITSNQSTSFLYRFLKDLTVAGLLVFIIKLIQRSFHSNHSNEVNDIIKNLQKSIQDMQTSVTKLEQTTDLLNLNIKTSNTNQSSSLSIEEIKQQVQELKQLSLGRLQFPQVSLWQSNRNKSNLTTTDSDNDGIIVISEQDKKSDDENLSSNDN